MKPSFYKQIDSRWSAKRYKCVGGTMSIGGGGCGPTSVANVVSALVRPVSPVAVMKYACKKGYVIANQGTTWDGIGKLLKHYGVTKFSITTSPAKARNSLREGHFMIAVVGPSRWTRGGHYIVPYKLKDSGKILISDPASYTDYRQKDGGWAEFSRAVKCMWYDIDPKDYPKGKKKKTKKQEEKKQKKETAKTCTFWVGKSVGADAKKGEKVVHIKYKKKLKVKSYKNGTWLIASGAYKGFRISEKVLSKYKPYKATFKVIREGGANVRKGYTTKSEKISTIRKGELVVCSKKKGDWAYLPAYKGWVKIKNSKNVYLKKIK